MAVGRVWSGGAPALATDPVDLEHGYVDRDSVDLGHGYLGQDSGVFVSQLTLELTNGIGDKTTRLKSFVCDASEYHSNLPAMLGQTSVADSGDPISPETEWISIIKFKRGVEGGQSCPLHP
jgi:hypothetical protein